MVKTDKGGFPMKNNRFAPILALLAAIVIAVVYFLLPGAEPIADANGPDDRSLAVLTEADIVADSYSSTAGLTISTGRITLPGGWEISDGVEISARELSGVTELLRVDYILPSDFYLELSSFTVESGNLRLVVVNEGRIVAEIEPGTDIVCRLDDLTGYTSLRLAAESARFTLVLPNHIYDSFEHS